MSCKTDFRDERSELIVPCDDECCAAVAADNGGRGSGLIDDCEDVSLPPSHPPSLDTADDVAVVRRTQQSLQ